MKGPIAWMAHNHVAANLLMMVFVVGGLVLGYSIKQEVFPEILLDKVQVSVLYPGASPEEVEEGIILKIEENLSGVDGIKELKSLALEGVGTVTATIDTGADADKVLQDVKSEVDRITTFPEDAEKPVTSKLVNRHEVVSLVVYGKASERTLREWAETMRDDLLALDDITQADLSGVRPYEISIEVPEANLRRYNLTLEQIAQAVRKASLDLPGGSIKPAGGEILIRTKERRYHGAGYEEIVVKVNADATRVRIKDIGTVRDTFEETDTYATFDGMPAAMVRVYRVGDQKPLAIADLVRGYAAAKGKELPDSIKVAVWNDSSEIFQSRINLLLKNALLGLVLVFITLSLFLQMRLALWVMLGIPISFLGALFLMPALDASINMIALFAFIMALGIVVDDAIVVGENVYEHRQQGKSHLQAAIDGAREVGGPVVFSVLTSVAAFLPLLFIEGVLGKFIKVIPLVVITILMVSLIESLFVLPAHLSLGKAREKKSHGLTGGLDRLRTTVSRSLARFVQGPYRWQLNWCLAYRYATLAAALALLFITIGIIRGGVVKFRFMPEVDGDIITVNLEMPRGTLIRETGRIEALIVEKGKEVVTEYDTRNQEEQSILRHIYSVVGGTIEDGGPVGGGASTGTHLVNIAMLLAPSESRGVAATEISNRWREKIGEIPGADTLTFTSNLIRMGANIDVQLAHDDINALIPAVDRLKKVLGQYPGVTDIADNYPLGKREVKLMLTAEARTLGITEEDLARQIRGAFYGAEALRLQRGRNEVKVMVRYPEQERNSLGDLESMRIRTPAGGELPLGRAALLTGGRGYSEINRMDRKRVINVTATVDSKQANTEEILTELKEGPLKQLSADYPGMTYSLEGEEKERRDSMRSMLSGFALALFGIYALLAIPFRSYSQPLLIMVAIPFGIVGAVLGHLFLGFNLSMLSLFGIVALSGVVVNDSLLLIDFINSHRREGKPLAQAVLDAGQRRFRPILLTSLTTFFGLMPMIFETSVQAQFLIPMAISLGCGILFATGITLLLVPTLYVTLEEIKELVRGRPSPL
ncbi:efflux RND transporter permease subunit [Thiovibrio sp. JS02]